jgi:hypothetical protein
VAIVPAGINVAEIVVNGTVASGGSNSRAWATVWHYRRTATAVNPTKAALVTAFLANIKAEILAALNIRLTLTSVYCRWLNDAEDAYSITTTTGTGGVAGDSMPTDNAVFVLMQTGVRGRFAKGGKHWFPIGESATTTPNDDILNAGAITYFSALTAKMLLAVTDATTNIWVPCILSRKKSQLKNNPTAVFTLDVTTVSLNKRIGSMRHRKVRSSY